MSTLAYISVTGNERYAVLKQKLLGHMDYSSFPTFFFLYLNYNLYNTVVINFQISQQYTPQGVLKKCFW